MIRLLLENEADCLTRQHTEPRSRPLTKQRAWPEPSTARAVSFCEVQRSFRRRAGPILFSKVASAMAGDRVP